MFIVCLLLMVTLINHSSGLLTTDAAVNESILQVKDLPIGSKVADPNTTHLNGTGISWIVVAKDHSGYPANSVTLMTEKIVTIQAFDAKEPNHSNSNIKIQGNAEYQYSNIRQWLNSDKEQWFRPLTSTDEPPTWRNVDGVFNDTSFGFLRDFSDEFKGALIPTPVITNHLIPFFNGTISLESYQVEDKVFLLSSSEVGLVANNEEGTLMPYFTTNEERLAYPTTGAIQNTFYFSQYSGAELDEGNTWDWLLRTPRGFRNMSHVNGVTKTGTLSTSIPSYNGYMGIRPAVNINGDTTVRKLDNGTYQLFAGELPVEEPPIGVDINITLSATPNTWTKDKVTIESQVTTNNTSQGSTSFMRKWAKGEQNLAYFDTSGILFKGTSFNVAENGIYTVFVKDGDGNKAIKTIDISNIDTSAPVLSLTQDPPDANGKVKIHVKANDTPSGLEMVKWEYGSVTEEFFSSTGNILEGTYLEVSENGIVSFYAKDLAGNSVIQTITVASIENDEGTSLHHIDVLQSPFEWTNQNVTLRLSMRSGEPIVRPERPPVDKLPGDGGGDDGGDIIVDPIKPPVEQMSFTTASTSLFTFKYAEGVHDKSFFTDGGTAIDGSNLVVTKNGDYTIYGQNSNGDSAILVYKVNNIDKVPPLITMQQESTKSPVKVNVTYSDALSGVNIVKWAKGEQTASYFKDDGTNIIGTNFEVTESGVYTAYVIDKAGNESISTRNIDMTDLSTISRPTFTADITSPTEGPVTVTIKYVDEAIAKEYRVITKTETTEWKEYGQPILMTGNGMIEARQQMENLEWSATGRFSVNNILSEDETDGSEGADRGYSLPLQQSVMNDLGMNGSKREFEWEYASDLYFVSKHTGFQVGYSYADAVKTFFNNEGVLPTATTIAQQGITLAEERFQTETGRTLNEEIMYVEDMADLEKFQRYYVPISSDSNLLPDTEYENITSLSNVGLNDLTLEYAQKFTFDRYLFGSGADDAFIIEQVDSRTEISEMDSDKVHRITLTTAEVKELAKLKAEQTTNRIHDFRFSDRSFTEKVRDLLGLE